MIVRYEKSLFSSDSHYCSNPGTEEIDEFVIDYPAKGGVRLKKTGTIPLYKQIQANKSNCELSSVLETCIHQNQLAVCSADDISSAVADFSGYTDMAEWYSGMKHVEEIWKKTPVEVREQFNSSKANFISSIGDSKFMEKINNGFDNYFGAISKRLDGNNKPSVESIPSLDNTVVDDSVQKEVLV